MNHFPQAWGRVSRTAHSVKTIKTYPCQPRDDVYGPYDHSYLQASAPTKHTQQPIVTGTSVLAVKFKEGIVIAADNLGKLPVVLVSCKSKVDYLRSIIWLSRPLYSRKTPSSIQFLRHCGLRWGCVRHATPGPIIEFARC